MRSDGLFNFVAINGKKLIFTMADRAALNSLRERLCARDERIGKFSVDDLGIELIILSFHSMSAPPRSAN